MFAMKKKLLIKKKMKIHKTKMPNLFEDSDDELQEQYALEMNPDLTNLITPSEKIFKKKMKKKKQISSKMITQLLQKTSAIPAPVLPVVETVPTNATTETNYKSIHCPSCCVQALSVVEIKRDKSLLTQVSFPIKACKRCGTVITKANYVRFCTNCKQYALCMNCVACPAGHSAHKSVDVSIGSENAGSLYKVNTYNCDSCNTVKNVKPYIWRCRICEWDVCPMHVFGLTHVWESNTKIEKVEGGIRYVWDPFWDRYVKKAEEAGAEYEKVGKCVEGMTEVL